MLYTWQPMMSRDRSIANSLFITGERNCTKEATWAGTDRWTYSHRFKALNYTTLETQRKRERSSTSVIARKTIAVSSVWHSKTFLCLHIGKDYVKNCNTIISTVNETCWKCLISKMIVEYLWKISHFFQIQNWKPRI